MKETARKTFVKKCRRDLRRVIVERYPHYAIGPLKDDEAAASASGTDEGLVIKEEDAEASLKTVTSSTSPASSTVTATAINNTATDTTASADGKSPADVDEDDEDQDKETLKDGKAAAATALAASASGPDDTDDGLSIKEREDIRAGEASLKKFYDDKKEAAAKRDKEIIEEKERKGKEKITVLHELYLQDKDLLKALFLKTCAGYENEH